MATTVTHCIDKIIFPCQSRLRRLLFGVTAFIRPSASYLYLFQRHIFSHLISIVSLSRSSQLSLILFFFFLPPLPLFAVTFVLFFVCLSSPPFHSFISTQTDSCAQPALVQGLCLSYWAYLQIISCNNSLSAGAMVREGGMDGKREGGKRKKKSVFHLMGRKSAPVRLCLQKCMLGKRLLYYK